MGLRTSLLLAVATAVACTVQLDAPAGVRITCDDGRCPNGWECNRTSMFCVPAGRTDDTPPAIESAAVEPSIVNDVTPIEVTIRVSEPLLIEPRLTFPNGGRTRDMTLQGGEAETYRFGYTAENDTHEARSPLSVELVDRAGNVTRGEIGLEVAFDFTPPSLAGGTVVTLVPSPDNRQSPPAEMRRDTEAVVHLQTSEPLASLTVFATPRADGCAPAELACDSSGVLHTCRWLPGGGACEGAHDLDVRLRDVANNEAVLLVSVGALVVDGTAPLTPQTSVSGAVVYTRRPHGDRSGGGSFTIEGAAGAVDGGSTVVVLDGDSAPAVELARAGARDDGSFGPVAAE